MKRSPSTIQLARDVFDLHRCPQHLPRIHEALDAGADVTVRIWATRPQSPTLLAQACYALLRRDRAQFIPLVLRLLRAGAPVHPGAKFTSLGGEWTPWQLTLFGCAHNSEETFLPAELVNAFVQAGLDVKAERATIESWLSKQTRPITCETVQTMQALLRRESLAHRLPQLSTLCQPSSQARL